MFSHRLVCICQARAAFADVVLQYFSPKVPILRQIHREIAMALTGRPNPRPLFVQRIAKKKWYWLLQAQLSSFVKFFQVTSWIVSVLTKWHHIYGRSSDDHCLRSPRLEQSNDALMEVSFDASAEELHLSCRRITNMKKKSEKCKILIHFDTHSANWGLNFFKDPVYQHTTPFSDICSIFADLFGWNTGFRTSGARSLLHFLILLWFQQQLHCKAGSHFVSLCHCLSWLFSALFGTVGEKPPWQVALNWVLRPGGEAKSYPGHWQSLRLEYCSD